MMERTSGTEKLPSLYQQSVTMAAVGGLPTQEVTVTDQAPVADHPAAAFIGTVDAEPAPDGNQPTANEPVALVVHAAAPQAAAFIGALLEPVPAGGQYPVNEPVAPVAAQAAAPQAAAFIGALLEPVPAGGQTPVNEPVAPVAVQASVPQAAAFIGALLEPVPAGGRDPVNEPVPPVAVQAAVPQAAAGRRPFYHKRRRNARARVDRHLDGPGPVSDNSRFTRIAQKINILQGGNQELNGLSGEARIRQLLPDAANLVGIDKLLNAAADFCDANEQNPPAA